MAPRTKDRQREAREDEVNGKARDLLLMGTLGGEGSHLSRLREGGDGRNRGGPASISNPGLLPQPQLSPSSPVATVALNWYDSVPAAKGTFGNVWGHFCCCHN